MIVLTDGKIVVCNNKVYAGRNKIDLTKDTVYVHPSSKQCDFQGARAECLFSGKVSGSDIANNTNSMVLDFICTANLPVSDLTGLIFAIWKNITVTFIHNTDSGDFGQIDVYVSDCAGTTICEDSFNATLPLTKTLNWQGPYRTYYLNGYSNIEESTVKLSPRAVASHRYNEKLRYFNGNGISLSFDIELYRITV